MQACMLRTYVRMYVCTRSIPVKKMNQKNDLGIKYTYSTSDENPREQGQEENEQQQEHQQEGAC